MKNIHLSLLLWMFAVAHAHGDPLLVVLDDGTDINSVRQWTVGIVAGAEYSTDSQGALAIELGLQVLSGDIVSVETNDAQWPYQNPGNDPFTGGISMGVTSNSATGTVFAALGSDRVAAGEFLEVLTLHTTDPISLAIAWGGQTLLPGSDYSYIGSRIAQGGVNFDSYEGIRQAGTITCDFNGRDGCNVVDLDLLSEAIVSDDAGPQYNIDGDTRLDIHDVDAWLSAAGGQYSPPLGAFLRGDANLDGAVNEVDLAVLMQHLFRDDARWSHGDFNTDGVIDGRDFGLWNANKNRTSQAANAVPEPGYSGVIFLMLGLMWYSGCRVTSRTTIGHSPRLPLS